MLLPLAIAGAALTGLTDDLVGVCGIEGTDEDNLSAFGGRVEGDAIAGSVWEYVTLRCGRRPEGEVFTPLFRTAWGVIGESEEWEPP